MMEKVYLGLLIQNLAYFLLLYQVMCYLRDRHGSWVVKSFKSLFSWRVDTKKKKKKPDLGGREANDYLLTKY